MAALHSALQSLGPCKFEDIPSSQTELERYLDDLFKQSRLIVESIPIPPPEEKPDSRPRSHTTSSVASNASQISSSSARSAPPIPDHASLQKEWGKPIKLAAKDNPLNMAVYKLGGKDGRGAWFARRSVHEGLGFAKFKKSLEMEFSVSLAVKGAPGEGNIRGIGGDKRVEDISVPGKGRVEVFQLSAQFPGPTTPRDFVTLLITSSNAINQDDDSASRDLAPRHYMIISKPCDHPETQARNGYVRGSYESVEFIREVPRSPKKTSSSHQRGNAAPGQASALDRQAVLRSAEKAGRANTFSTNHENKSANDLDAAPKAKVEENRKRGNTISFSEPRADQSHVDDDEEEEQDEPESNPVEWIMVTRSDPGGSVPRFMVERGTPGSIIADASKFLDWACWNEQIKEDSKSESNIDLGRRQDSLPSDEVNGHVVGINGDPSTEGVPPPRRPSMARSASHSQADSTTQSGILSSMAGVFSAGLETYAPQVVLDRLPGHTSQASEETAAGTSTTLSADVENGDDETSDSLSTTSFASADSHLDNESSHHNMSPTASESTLHRDHHKNKEVPSSPHEKELQKLETRRATLDAKLASTRSKSAKDAQSQTAKEKDAIRKAEEKHAKEMARQEDKYRKEIGKIERRREREEKKAEEKKRKEAEKDERKKWERERDEAREEVKRLKGEISGWRKQVGQLQKENTGLVVRVGKLEEEVRELKEMEGGVKDVLVVGKPGFDDGQDKNTEKETEKSVHATVLDKDAVKNLLKEEDRFRGRARTGVSSGSASASDVDSVKSKSSSSFLKRSVTLGLGARGGGSGSADQDKGSAA